ncbi:MAG: hypothetical protein WC712_06730 [Candidatus Brocadiia bacterium]
MTAVGRAVLVLTIVLFVGLATIANAEEFGICGKCRNTGKVPCAKCKVEYPYFCSAARSMTCCYELGWTLCPMCKGKSYYEVAETEQNDYLGSVDSWAANQANKVENATWGKDGPNHKVIHIASKYWVLSTNMNGRDMKLKCLPWPIPRWLAVAAKAENIRKTMLDNFRFKADGHLAAHVYVERLDYVYDVFSKVYTSGAKSLDEADNTDTPADPANPDITPEEEGKIEPGPGKNPYYCWRTVSEQTAATHVLGGQTTEQPLNCFGPMSGSSHTIQYDAAGGNDDMLLHDFVHNAVHLKLEDYGKFVIDAVPQWFGEANSHWFEYTILGSVTCICWRETTGNGNMPNKGIRGSIFRMVSEKRHKPLSAFANANLAALTVANRVQSMGLVDYMFKVYPDKVAQWVSHVKDHKDQGAAFRDVLGVSMSDFDTEWAAWVLKNYKDNMQ